MDKQSKTEITLVPSHAAPIGQDTELGEQVSSQNEGTKKAACNKSHDANPNTQLEGPVTNKSVKESPSRKRALTPPYIPEMGLHQTWPAFGFKSVSKEGARALRHRTVKIDNFADPNKQLEGTVAKKSIKKSSSMKRAVMINNFVDLNTQPEEPVTNKSVKESLSRKRALTPPYIPEMGLHQTWPAFGFKSVSKEGARALRHRTVKIDNFEESPSNRGSRSSKVQANQKQDSVGKYSGTAPAETGEEDHIRNQDPKTTRKSRLPSLPNLLLIRRQAASMKATEKRSALSAAPNSEGLVIRARAVHWSQKPSDNVADSW